MSFAGASFAEDELCGDERCLDEFQPRNQSTVATVKLVTGNLVTSERQ